MILKLRAGRSWLKRFKHFCEQEWVVIGTGRFSSPFTRGCGLHNAANLKWEAIDLDGRWISYKVSKTRQRIKVPMHDALYRWLKKQIRGINKAPLFPELAGKSTNVLSREFSKLMASVGVHGEIVRDRQGDSGRLVSSLGFYSLRHSYASMMANRGVSEEVRMKLARHAAQSGGFTRSNRATALPLKAICHASWAKRNRW